MKIFRLIILLLPILSSCSTEKKFDFPINEIESIKYDGDQKNTYYRYIEMTPEIYKSNYSGTLQETTVSFLYKDKKASIHIVFNFEENILLFIKTAESGDYFLKAIAELYDEPSDNIKMKDTLECSSGFTEGNYILTDGFYMFKTIYRPNPDTQRGSVSIALITDLSNGFIELGEKESGLAKKNFVDAFRADKP